MEIPSKIQSPRHVWMICSGTSRSINIRVRNLRTTLHSSWVERGTVEADCQPHPSGGLRPIFRLAYLMTEFRRPIEDDLVKVHRLASLSREMVIRTLPFNLVRI